MVVTSQLISGPPNEGVKISDTLAGAGTPVAARRPYNRRRRTTGDR